MDEVKFKECYQRYHAEKDLETLFDVAHNVLVKNRTIKEGVDFVHLENFIDQCWAVEKLEHDGNEVDAFTCYKESISNKILHGWVVNHLRDGRSFVGEFPMNCSLEPLDTVHPRRVYRWMLYLEVLSHPKP